MNVWTKFNGNLSNSCGVISIWTKMVEKFCPLSMAECILSGYNCQQLPFTTCIAALIPHQPDPLCWRNLASWTWAADEQQRPPQASERTLLLWQKKKGKEELGSSQLHYWRGKWEAGLERFTVFIINFTGRITALHCKCGYSRVEAGSTWPRR